MKPFTFFVLLLFLSNCTTKKIDPEAVKSEVKLSIDAFLQSYFMEDLETISKALSSNTDIVFIGTEEGEFVTDRNALLAAYQEQIKALKFTNIETIKEKINVHSCGEIAWVARIDNVTAKMGDENIFIKNLRWTAVLQKVDGRWVFVQSHSSLPAKP